MARLPLEVADIVRQYGQAFIKARPDIVTSTHRRVLADILACRTASLGGHLYRCDACDYRHVAYNACRNRHCPACGGRRQAQWTTDRQHDLLPVQYFHVVFTLPHALGPLALQNKRRVYGLLFKAVAETLLQLAADSKRLGARLGFVAVLHTWGQSLEHHPHIHCLVPGGGLTLDGTGWVHCRKNFLLPIRVMRALFRGKLLAFLRDAYRQGKLTLCGRLEHLRDPQVFARLLRPLTKTKWVVYAKPPFAGAEQVLKYLARYTHRVALSNRRLVAMEHGHVTFKWKDYRDGQQKLMRVDAHEFLRRFLLHVLPRGFVRIRHFGILANRGRKQALAQARALIAAEPPPRTVKRQEEPGTSSSAVSALFTCPRCHQGVLLLIGRLTAESAPSQQGWDTS